MDVGELGYRSFLLRLWLVKQNGEISWRASLEDPHTGQQHLFSSPEALNEFLWHLKRGFESEMDFKKDIA